MKYENKLQLLLERLRLFTVWLPLSGCAQFRLFLELLLQLVLFSLRIDDFVIVNGGGCDNAFDGSVSICCCVVAVNCALTFQDHANGGALHIISCNNNNNNEYAFHSISTHTFIEDIIQRARENWY